MTPRASRTAWARRRGRRRTQRRAGTRCRRSGTAPLRSIELDPEHAEPGPRSLASLRRRSARSAGSARAGDRDVGAAHRQRGRRLAADESGADDDHLGADVAPQLGGVGDRADRCGRRASRPRGGRGRAAAPRSPAGSGRTPTNARRRRRRCRARGRARRPRPPAPPPLRARRTRRQVCRVSVRLVCFAAQVLLAQRRPFVRKRVLGGEDGDRAAAAGLAVGADGGLRRRPAADDRRPAAPRRRSCRGAPALEQVVGGLLSVLGAQRRLGAEDARGRRRRSAPGAGRRRASGPRAGSRPAPARPRSGAVPRGPDRGPSSRGPRRRRSSRTAPRGVSSGRVRRRSSTFRAPSRRRAAWPSAVGLKSTASRLSQRGASIAVKTPTEQPSSRVVPVRSGSASRVRRYLACSYSLPRSPRDPRIRGRGARSAPPGPGRGPPGRSSEASRRALPSRASIGSSRCWSRNSSRSRRARSRRAPVTNGCEPQAAAASARTVWAEPVPSASTAVTEVAPGTTIPDTDEVGLSAKKVRATCPAGMV